MPSADFCSAIRPPRGALSRRSDTEQISWGKLSRLPCTVARSKLRDVADRCGFGLDLPALGAQGGALGLEVGKGGAFMLALVRERRPALALPLNRRERRIGPAALGGLLDREVDLVKPPIEIGDRMGLDIDTGRQGLRPASRSPT